MANLELPYVQRFDDRHGKPRHYFRRAGFKRTTLPGDVGSKEFMIAYDKALKASRGSAGEERTVYRSISALIVEYYGTANFKGLEPSTQATYRNQLDRFRGKYGDKSALTIQTHHLEAIFHAMSDTPGATRNLRKRLRKVFRLAVKLGWRADNPVTETEAPDVTTTGFTPWTEEDIEAYEKRWPAGTRERLALALLIYTGVRRSDVVGMGRQHRQGSKIKVTVMKGRKRTPTTLLIPVHPTLQLELDGLPLDNLTYLVTQYGRPFSAAGFTSWFVERAKLAGLQGRTPHGLRKAAGRRLAEAECTAKQIASILGHKTLSEVERYTRDADQGRLADQAMDKLTSQQV